MKVLLISANTEQINMPVLPLGMACVAAAAQNAGHEVKTVNLMMAQDAHMLLEKAVAGFKPEVIGISVRNIDDQIMEHPKFLLAPVKAVVAECRRLSDAPIVLGGAGYSIFPREVLDYLKADMGIQGEGEQAFVMLLERLKRKTDLL
ncbi:MAG: cobalamin-dependent protein, partial [Proteobacteria bacterium]|nr:cobalamin-dependent protein [Pseudomonadota bacterium]